MILFVGLGNPGRAYAQNRHNIGFRAVESIARANRAPAFRTKFHGVVSEISLSDTRVALLMPQTFMNESGRAVGEAARYLKIEPQEIVVFHDELDLPPGKVRVKTGGGNAGHNGLKSITAHIGNEYRRVRLGIGHPGDRSLVHNYVLGDFAKAETTWVEALCDAIAADAGLLAAGEDDAFQTRMARAMEAAGLP